jgi:hypothetical protein
MPQSSVFYDKNKNEIENDPKCKCIIYLENMEKIYTSKYMAVNNRNQKIHTTHTVGWVNNRRVAQRQRSRACRHDWSISEKVK